MQTSHLIFLDLGVLVYSNRQVFTEHGQVPGTVLTRGYQFQQKLLPLWSLYWVKFKRKSRIKNSNEKKFMVGFFLPTTSLLQFIHQRDLPNILHRCSMPNSQQIPNEHRNKSLPLRFKVLHILASSNFSSLIFQMSLSWTSCSK